MNAVSERIDQLRREIRHHDRQYYVEAAPDISDRAYDALLDELMQFERAHPELLTADSPSQRVGGEPIDGFRTVRHARRMYSIDNTYDRDELSAWHQRVLKGLELDVDQQIDYLAEPKIDGVAISLRYQSGLLAQALTRGDGSQGDDVTQNIRTIRSIPLRLGNEGCVSVPEVLEVRGEIFMPVVEFDRINEQREAAGLERFANPRNATAGTLKQLDSQAVAQRRLAFIAHGQGELSGEPFSCFSEFLRALEAWGVPVNPLARHCGTFDEVWSLVEQFDARRQSLGYGVDGVVIKVDSIDQQARLGFTSRFPRWCIAYKYAAEQAATRLLRVDWQVGKTGKLTPRATMEPVFVSGTTVRHANLHNLGEIRRKDIRIGDTVLVEKAGEIIPQVMAVVLAQRPADAVPIEAPGECPECGGEVEAEQDADAKETTRYCINPECPAQFRERLIHFAGRAQMDIDGLGDELIDKLLKSGLVTHFADLYALEETALAKLTHVSVVEGKDVEVRLGEKNAARILRSLEDSKDRGLARVLSSLGIRHVGTETARVVASKVADIDELLVADLTEIRSVVSEQGRRVQIEKAREVADAFLTALHSLEGEQYVRQARELALAQPGSDELALLLESLPANRTWRVQWGSGGGGKKDLLNRRFASLDELCAAAPGDLVELFVPDVVGTSLYDFLHSERGRETVASLRQAGLDMSGQQQQAAQVGESPLRGKTVVVTGTLSEFTRDQIHQLIREHGGKPVSSVSKSTDYLVAGEKAGSKRDKAEALGVSVISESEFQVLIGQ